MMLECLKVFPFLQLYLTVSEMFEHIYFLNILFVFVMYITIILPCSNIVFLSRIYYTDNASMEFLALIGVGNLCVCLKQSLMW